MKRIFSSLGLLALLAGCHQAAPGARLDLAMSPPTLKPGQLVQVSAKPVPMAQMSWISGTVKVLGFPSLAFTKDPIDGIWKFRTMIPVFASVPPGTYQVRAWGESTTGLRYDGSMNVEVK